VKPCVNPNHLTPMLIGEHLRMHYSKPYCGTCGELKTGKNQNRLRCLACARRRYHARRDAS
jgi:tRNA(Ile2) C34 agmatinyltransferase TiaS